MKYLLLVMISASAFAQDPTQDLIKHLTKDNDQNEKKDYCDGNPPGSDDGWCSWTCIDGRWSRVCSQRRVR
jgi:hypothetical protein